MHVKKLAVNELRRIPYRTSRIILAVAAIIGCAVLIGAILLELTPRKPFPCNRLLVHIDYERLPKNDAERRAREKPRYLEAGFGCP